MNTLKKYENMPLPFYGVGPQWNENVESGFLENLENFQTLELPPELFLSRENKELLAKLKMAQLPILLHPQKITLNDDVNLIPDQLKQIKSLAEELPVIGCVFPLDTRQHQDRPISLPWTMKVVDQICTKIEKIQKQTSLPVFLKNAPPFHSDSLGMISELSEMQFINLLLNRTGCFLDLDLDLVYFNSIYHQFDPYSWIDQIEISQIAVINMGKEHFQSKNLFIQGCSASLWKLYSYLVQKICPSMVIVENVELEYLQLTHLKGKIEKAKKILEDNWFSTHEDIDLDWCFEMSS